MRLRVVEVKRWRLRRFVSPDFERECVQQWSTLLLLRKSISDFNPVCGDLFLSRTCELVEKFCLISLSRNPLWYGSIRVDSSLQIRCPCIVSRTWVRVLWVGMNGGVASAGVFGIGHKGIPGETRYLWFLLFVRGRIDSARWENSLKYSCPWACWHWAKGNNKQILLHTLIWRRELQYYVLSDMLLWLRAYLRRCWIWGRSKMFWGCWRHNQLLLDTSPWIVHRSVWNISGVEAKHEWECRECFLFVGECLCQRRWGGGIRNDFLLRHPSHCPFLVYHYQ